MNNKNNISDKRPPLIPMLIGTGFGSGFWPWGPGTAGSIVALIGWFALSSLFHNDNSAIQQYIIIAFILLFTCLGTWAIRILQPYWGEDPSKIVIDEMVGIWIPLSILQPEDYLGAILALISFRIFDIFKPFGIKTLDHQEGAFWVMADDILAGTYSLIIITIYLQIFRFT